MKINLDEDRLIVQTNGDGGDCAARSGTLILGLKFREKLGISNVEWGIRPDEYWQRVRWHLFLANQPLRYTRGYSSDDVPADQFMPLVMAAIVMGDQDTAQLLRRNLIQNFSRFPNGNPAGPQDYMIWNPENWFGQMQFYLGTLIRCEQSTKDGDDVGDDIRHVMTLALMRYFYGKPLASCESVYRRHRQNWSYSGTTLEDRKNPACYKKIPGPGAQYAFDHYFDPITGANPLNELWRPIISDILSKE